jgi:sigma-B regulation protein RsbU (phosphoserine phosphatase)
MPIKTAIPSSTSTQRSSENRLELTALFEFSTIVNASFDLSFVLNHFLLTVMGKLLSLRGMIMLSRDKTTFAVETVKGLPRTLVGAELSVSKLPLRIQYTRELDDAKASWRGFFQEHGIELIVPLVAQRTLVGIAGFAPGRGKGRLAGKEATYVRSLANIAAASIEKSLMIGRLSHVNRQLDKKIQELNTLFELSKEFNAVLEPERLLKLLMYSIMGHIGANRFALCLNRNGVMEVLFSRLAAPVSEPLKKFFCAMKSPVFVRDLTRKSHTGFREELNALGIVALVPLHIQQETKGVLVIGEKLRGEQYSSTDLEFLFSLGNLAIISIENARLVQETLEKQRLEDELLIAKTIQQGLLPSTLPSIPGVDLAAINLSSKQVGGDYYDVIALGNDRFVLAIGDVSGKGTPASLLMANLQATIRALVPLDLSLSELTKRVNDLLCENTGNDRFITFFWGILDAREKVMRYVSAGHNPPFLLRAGGAVERLDKGGLILGVMKTLVPYEEGAVRLGPGDLLVLFTDGVSEAMDVRGEEWGEEPIERIASERRAGSAEEVMSEIIEQVREHGKQTQQSDDITLLVLKMVTG